MKRQRFYWNSYKIIWNKLWSNWYHLRLSVESTGWFVGTLFLFCTHLFWWLQIHSDLNNRKTNGVLVYSDYFQQIAGLLIAPANVFWACLRFKLEMPVWYWLFKIHRVSQMFTFQINLYMNNKRFFSWGI